VRIQYANAVGRDGKVMATNFMLAERDVQAVKVFGNQTAEAREILGIRNAPKKFATCSLSLRYC
jgi:hypothetical protein